MKLTLPLLVVSLITVFTHLQVATAKENPVTTSYVVKQRPHLSAKAYLLYDYSSKQVLLEQNSLQHIAPASLTKLMTAYVVFKAIQQKKLKLEEMVTPSAFAVKSQREDTKMYLSTRKPVSISDLLHGLIIASANDGARVLAETLAGSEPAFAELMNKEARQLGMLNSHFVNASGLPDPQHYSSAYDLTLLTAAILSEFPDYLALYSQREFEYKQIKHYNRNRLLWIDPYVDGMKTGHTENAGYCLVATANRDKHRLISVVLGNASDHSRTSESQRLLNYGYQEFEVLFLYQKNQTIQNIRIWKGTENTVKAGIREGLTITLPKSQNGTLKATIETQQPLLAPISDGQQIGTLRLMLDEKPYLEYPLVALEPVPLVNIFSRGIDSIRMIFSSL